MGCVVYEFWDKYARTMIYRSLWRWWYISAMDCTATSQLPDPQSGPELGLLCGVFVHALVLPTGSPWVSLLYVTHVGSALR